MFQIFFLALVSYACFWKTCLLVHAWRRAPRFVSGLAQMDTAGSLGIETFACIHI